MSTEPKYDLFNREENGLPKAILVRFDLRTNRPPLEYAVVAHFPFNASISGFPTPRELERLVSIEKALTSALAALGAIHVGHMTYKGDYHILYHAPVRLPTELTVKTGLFKKEQIKIDVRHDPNWNWYEAEMAPTPADIECAENMSIHYDLEQNGDLCEIPREVMFWASFPSDDDRTAFLSSIAEEKYAFSHNIEAVPPTPFGCEFTTLTTVESYLLAPRCAYLRERARHFGGEFDGWATPVTKSR